MVLERWMLEARRNYTTGRWSRFRCRCAVDAMVEANWLVEIGYTITGESFGETVCTKRPLLIREICVKLLNNQKREKRKHFSLISTHSGLERLLLGRKLLVRTPLGQRWVILDVCNRNPTVNLFFNQFCWRISFEPNQFERIVKTN